MAREGARVFATDLKPHLLEQYSGIPNIVTRPLDVLDDAAIAHLADDLPPLDILFNCAGYVHNGTILDCEPKDWDFSFNLNVRAMYMTIKRTLPKMLAKVESTGRATSIINMASIASSVKGLPNRFVYGASKAAVIGLTKAWAREYASRGITVNAVSPGYIDTDMTAADLPPDRRAELLKAIPLGRAGRPEDVAAAVAYLASPAAGYITGEVLRVNGGLLM